MAFLHGRPGPHWTHGAFARHIGAEFRYVDESARWHDISLFAPIRYIRWLHNAVTFPYHEYEVILTEGPHVWPPFGGRYLGKKPVFCLLGNQTAYFLYSGFFSSLTQKGLLAAFRRYHALIVIGQMQVRLLQELLGDEMPPYFVGKYGLPSERLRSLERVRPTHETPRILLIAHGEEGWRTWYKGLDVFCETIERVRRVRPEVEGVVIGSWTQREQARLLSLYPDCGVRFVGPTQDLESWIHTSTLYLHLARGDAWPVSILEAMAGGLPVIASEWTGTAEVVHQVWPEGVSPLSSEEAAARVLWYLDLPISDRTAIGEKGRRWVNAHYRLDQALSHFETLFSAALEQVGLSVP
ncbi:MAG: glycosyltransferase family 4 protein [Bacteroidia bacterium]|nr:glycosyltransferase family 4 protein [Bacteroidia bacterium]